VRGYAAGSLLFDEGDEDEDGVGGGEVEAALTEMEIEEAAVRGSTGEAQRRVDEWDQAALRWVGEGSKIGESRSIENYPKHIAEQTRQRERDRRSSSQRAGGHRGEFGTTGWLGREGPSTLSGAERHAWDVLLADTKDNPAETRYIEQQMEIPVKGGLFGRERPRRADELIPYSEESKLGLDARYSGTYRTEAEREAEGDEEEEESLERSLEDILDTGQGGLDDILATLGTGRIDDYRERVQDPERLKATHQAEKDTAQGMLNRAGGIRNLQDARADQQKSMLADSLGISEARIEELMGEMDTEGEIDSRRKADALKNLSFMFMDSPANLAENIRGTTSGIEGLDATLKKERSDATKAIFAEREKRQTKKEVGLSGIFTTEEGALKDTDVAQKAFDTVGAQILREQADGTIEGEKEALSAYIDLAKVRAQQMGVWNSTMASANAAMQSAISTRDNSVADFTKWENIMNMFADLRNNAETPKQLEYFNSVYDLASMAAAKTAQQQSMAILSDDPRQATVGKLVTKGEVRDRSKDGSFMSRYDKDGNLRRAL
jgi:hypothetical protein